ncbi:hypothetical protein RJ641_025769 [Dillenia turbinata]|uniref:Pentatricopeptide repeat-containing protein n=1 Tax=Dillenia turbinata TaxID=194707 RepID=A0AAN8WEX1_9MAGN
MCKLRIGRTIQGGNIRTCRFSTMLQDQMSNQINARSMASPEDRYPNEVASPYSGNDVSKYCIGENIPRKEKINFLVSTLLDIRDNKEAVYGALDAWIAWEQNFPIASLKRVLAVLEKEQQWHRVVQVIKWMLSKGQANTMGTYGQLLRALDKDHRAEEAHQFWVKKVGDDLHSVSWQLCNSMISIYYRNNMLDRLVQVLLFPPPP